MPEGHTIHRLARQHTRWFRGQQVAVASPQGRFGDASVVDGAAFVRAEAHGKHLFHRYADGRSVHIHLGLFGKVFVDEVGQAGPPTPRGTSQYRVVGDDRVIDLVGANTCELLTPEGVDAVTAKLGPDPLRPDGDPDRVWAALQRRSTGIGRALMDQTVLAGVGNVYRAEILFVTGVHPEVPARAVPRDVVDAMWAQLGEWMRWGVRAGRIVTTDPAEVGASSRGRIGEGDRTYVYKQDRCRRCGTEIRRWDLAGRWAYACESCQKGSQR